MRMSFTSSNDASGPDQWIREIELDGGAQRA